MTTLKFTFGFISSVLMTVSCFMFFSCQNDETLSFEKQDSSNTFDKEIKAFAKSLEKNMRLYDEGKINLEAFDQNLLREIGQQGVKETGNSVPVFKLASPSNEDSLRNELISATAVEEYCAKHYSESFSVIISYLLYKHEIPLTIQEIIDSNELRNEEKLRLLIATYYLFVAKAKEAQASNVAKFNAPPIGNGPQQDKIDKCMEIYNRQIAECQDNLSISIAAETLIVGGAALGTLVTGGALGPVTGPAIGAAIGTAGGFYMQFEACKAKAEQARIDCVNKAS